ncbi:MAG: hypothetical protein EZS28_004264 [Streblomastix strix]|uniref:Uncharacterized protein n=1 Tax=Streblomastix strix TaxID=222440 RepID=A0A5J4WZA8_9EUKA|nr:MAG: hypothetical protein EZS28_004264 [Streblomastix strix]
MLTPNSANTIQKTLIRDERLLATKHRRKYNDLYATNELPKTRDYGSRIDSTALNRNRASSSQFIDVRVYGIQGKNIDYETSNKEYGLIQIPPLTKEQKPFHRIHIPFT